MQTKTIILNLIKDNPGGLTLTEISQKTKLGENLSLIPTVAKRYVLELICDGLICIEGKGGTYTITEKGISELELSTGKPIIVTSTIDERYAIMKQKLRNLSIKIK